MKTQANIKKAPNFGYDVEFTNGYGSPYDIWRPTRLWAARAARAKLRRAARRETRKKTHVGTITHGD